MFFIHQHQNLLSLSSLFFLSNPLLIVIILFHSSATFLYLHNPKIFIFSATTLDLIVDPPQAVLSSLIFSFLFWLVLGSSFYSCCVFLNLAVWFFILSRRLHTKEDENKQKKHNFSTKKINFSLPNIHSSILKT